MSKKPTVLMILRWIWLEMTKQKGNAVAEGKNSGYG